MTAAAVADPVFDAFPPPSGDEAPDEAAPEAPAEASSALTASSEAVAVPTTRAPLTAGLLGVLLLALLGGLVLNVMPCVLPVITLKLYGLVEHGDLSPGARRSAGLAYSGGVVASFWALAATVLVARLVFGVQLDWGSQFQYPLYVAALATVVVAFGLSLLGVFEVPVLGAGAVDEAASKEGLVGSFFTGVFATVLATPCSAPFLGTAVAYAFGAPAFELFLVMTAIGVGLAGPFLLIAFVPALYKFLPRPGEWMETLKQLLGFSLLATAVWLCHVLMGQIGEKVSWFLLYLVAVGLGCWVFGRFGGVAATRGRQAGAAAVGVGVAALAAFLFVDLTPAEAECAPSSIEAAALDFSDDIPWVPFSEPLLATLDGRPVFVDFTADWCLTCKANEAAVLDQPDVRRAMADAGIVPLQADWTRSDPVITEWLHRNGRAGVPMYLLLPKDRTQPQIVLPGGHHAGHGHRRRAAGRRRGTEPLLHARSGCSHPWPAPA
ncbi:MAG: thioredoxin family protein [Myxococcota bacterium]